MGEDYAALDGQLITEELSKYTKENILNGLPFALLYAADDELTRTRILHAIRARAIELGISAKEADQLCKAASADAKRRDAEMKRSAAKQTVMYEDGPLIGLAEMMADKKMPDFGKYICTNRSISTVTIQGIPIQVCGHPLFPTARYINIETGSELLDISYKLDGKWKTIPLVDRKTISQMRTITALSEYGLDITSENARDVVTYLAAMDQLNRQRIPRKETVSHLGWIRGRGFSPYIQGVSYDNGGKYAEAYAAIHERGSYDVWLDTAGKVMEDPDCMPARLVMAASVASILLKWTCQQPFIVHLWSPESGTGKTISLMLATSIWADPEMGKYMRSMNATKVANEQLAGFCNNLPLILDELQTVQKNYDFDDTIYMLCEGTGKARGAKDGGLREQSRWLNAVITSGEQSISSDSRAGAVNRVVSVEVSGTIIPGDMSEFADTLRANYGHAGKRLVERILSEDDFGEKTQRLYQDIVKELCSTATGKQANYGAALLTGDAVMCSLIFDGKYKPLKASDIIPFLATAEMVDTNEKVKDALIGFVAENAARFKKWNDNSEPVGPVYGKICENGDVMIIRTTLSKLLKECRRDLAGFMRWCYRREWLVTNYSPTSHHWEVMTKIPGTDKSSQVYHFRSEMFERDPSGAIRTEPPDLPF